MNLSHLPAHYVENCVARLRQIDMLRVPVDVPFEMRDDTIIPQDDWIGWKLVPSAVTVNQLNKLEEHLGLSYPLIYRQFLQSYHFYELWYLRFQEHPVRDWESGLLRLYDACSDLIERGLIPFGIEPIMDATVCFDTSRRQENGDCRVVFWDHECVGTDKEINPMFSSGEAMFRCLNFIAETPIDFLFHNEAVSPGALPEKQKLMAEFLALDPNEAGGTAKDYWTMDVKP